MHWQKQGVHMPRNEDARFLPCGVTSTVCDSAVAGLHEGDAGV